MAGCGCLYITSDRLVNMMGDWKTCVMGDEIIHRQSSVQVQPTMRPPALVDAAAASAGEGVSYANA